MADKLISADALKSRVLQGQFKIGQDGTWYVLGLIDSMPTIEAEPNSCEYWDSESRFCALRRPQAEPVKHGKWRVTHELKSWDIVYCSECGEGMWNAKGDNLPNYCYNCGAKMDEVTE